MGDDREALLQELERMPDFLAVRFSTLAADAAGRSGRGGAFSPVEQCWHLADLEREGFGVRIRRLLQEDTPLLRDFDGARIAEERQYRRKSLPEGMEAFRTARRDNLLVLRSLEGGQWSRSGSQEGVGKVAMSDLPRLMAEHDRAHKGEIEAWLEERRLAARVIVVGVVRNGHGEYLLCRMPEDRGVFPGEWGLPGGGLEPGETLDEAVRREILEEVGLELHEAEPLFFTDGTYIKSFPDGRRVPVYMVFLLFRCLARPGEIHLSPEFDDAAWVPREKLSQYSLNQATVATFSRLGLT